MALAELIEQEKQKYFLGVMLSAELWLFVARW